MTRSLASGRTSAMTSIPPRAAAMRSAVARRSPVSRVTRMPWARMPGDDRRGSRTQAILGGQDQGSLTLERGSRSGRHRRASSGSAGTRARRRCGPATRRCRRRPGRRPPARGYPGQGRRPPPPPGCPSRPMPSRVQRSSTAGRRGCSERRSRAPTRRSRSRCPGSRAAGADPSPCQAAAPNRQPVTSGRPSVRVPVLSKTKWSMDDRLSSTAPFLTRMPWRGAQPGGHGNGHGGGHAEGAGTGDDEDRGAGHEGDLDPGPHPEEEGQGPQGEGDGDEPGDDAIGDALDGGVARLGVLHQADDAPQGGVAQQAVDLDLERPRRH